MVVFWVRHKGSAELMLDEGVPLLPVVIKCGQRQCSELCLPMGDTACTAQKQKSCCWKRPSGQAAVGRAVRRRGCRGGVGGVFASAVF